MIRVFLPIAALLGIALGGLFVSHIERTALLGVIESDTVVVRSMTGRTDFPPDFLSKWDFRRWTAETFDSTGTSRMRIDLPASLGRHAPGTAVDILFTSLFIPNLHRPVEELNWRIGNQVGGTPRIVWPAVLIHAALPLVLWAILAAIVAGIRRVRRPTA